MAAEEYYLLESLVLSDEAITGLLLEEVCFKEGRHLPI